MSTGYTRSTLIFYPEPEKDIERKQRDYSLVDFGEAILRKAMNKLEFYQFNNLKSVLPNLQTLSEFIRMDSYLGKVKVEVEGRSDQIESLSSKQKLDIAVEVLEKISHVIFSDKVEFKGTREFKPYDVKKTFKDKTLNIYVKDSGDQEYGIAQSETNRAELGLDLSNKDWYVFNDNYGTSEEKFLVKFINKTYDSLKEKYDSVYLIRNEKHFQLYNFNDGRPLEPDFVLFLEKKDSGRSMHYQVFIEPKGDHLLKEDQWKENFLKNIKDTADIHILWKTKKYLVWGLPFYNEHIRKQEFEKEFGSIINPT